MASPFSVFRKRQKFLMALACLLAIVAFVFLPNMGNLIGDKSRGPANAVVVKTKEFGNLRESDMARLRGNRQKVRAVLTELAQMVSPYPGRVPGEVERIVGPLTDEALAETWLKAKVAQKMGMVVSDDAINELLGGWTKNSVKPKEIEGAINHTPTVTVAQFFDLMREWLLARQLDETFTPSLAAATPSQRWDWYNRLNCNAVIEAISVPVADYISKVDEPTDEELKKFFEENKDNLPDPESPKPGFRSPHKVALEYFKADMDKFATPKTVTDAEIRERYEQRKDYYDQIFGIPPTEPQAKPGAVKGAEKKDTNATKAKPEPKDSAKPKTPGEPKVEPKTPKADEKKPTAEKKEPGTPKETPKAVPKESDKTKDSKATSSVVRPSPFMLTAMQQTPAAKPETPAKTEVPAKPQSLAKAESPAAKPGQPAAKEQKPTAKEQKPAAKPAVSGKKPEAPNAELPKALTLYIRRELVSEKTKEKIQKIFDRLREPMKEYETKRRKYDLLAIQLKNEKKEVPPAPAEPDFKKLATENGLTTDGTKLMTQWQAKNSEIGDSMIEGRRPVWSYAYEALSNFRPTESRDAGALYLFWKVEDAKEYTPKFTAKGVREEVLRAWKLIRARDLAMKAAESMAAEARRAAKPLKQVWPDLRPILPPKFTWMTAGNVTAMQRPQAFITRVAGIDMPGDAFMQTVFRLDPGHVGVAFNSPQTMVYVVRPSEFLASYDVRWIDFKATSFDNYVAASAEDENRIYRAWFDDLKKSAGFEWGPGHKADLTTERETEREPPADEE
jgi:hypothetical protein